MMLSVTQQPQLPVRALRLAIGFASAAPVVLKARRQVGGEAGWTRPPLSPQICIARRQTEAEFRQGQHARDEALRHRGPPGRGAQQRQAPQAALPPQRRPHPRRVCPLLQQSTAHFCLLSKPQSFSTASDPAAMALNCMAISSPCASKGGIAAAREHFTLAWPCHHRDYEQQCERDSRYHTEM